MTGQTKATSLARNTVLVGDARTRLTQLPTGSVDMVLTSPPYFRLRDYQVAGQLGLEHEIEQWVTANYAATTVGNSTVYDLTAAKTS